MMLDSTELHKIMPSCVAVVSPGKLFGEDIGYHVLGGAVL